MIVPHGLVQLAANLNFGPELRTERIRTKLRCLITYFVYFYLLPLPHAEYYLTLTLAPS